MFSRQALWPRAQANQLLPKPDAPVTSKLRRSAIQGTRPVKATCRIAGVREIVGPLIWELVGKRDDGDNPFRFRAAPALDDG